MVKLIIVSLLSSLLVGCINANDPLTYKELQEMKQQCTENGLKPVVEDNRFIQLGRKFPVKVYCLDNEGFSYKTRNPSKK